MNNDILYIGSAARAFFVSLFGGRHPKPTMAEMVVHVAEALDSPSGTPSRLPPDALGQREFDRMEEELSEEVRGLPFLHQVSIDVPLSKRFPCITVRGLQRHREHAYEVAYDIDGPLMHFNDASPVYVLIHVLRELNDKILKFRSNA